MKTMSLKDVTSGKVRLHELFKWHRELVLNLNYTKRLLQMKRAQMDNTGGSIIELRGSEKKELLAKVSETDQLEKKIADLEEKRRTSQEELQTLSDRLKSDLQRSTIEAYCYEAFTWGEVAEIVYRSNNKNHRRTCQVHRSNAIKAMERMLEFRDKDDDNNQQDL